MKTAVRKKSYNLDGDAIEQVRRLLGAKTDTEAIRRALQKTIDDHELADRLDALLARGGFRVVYR
jgi:hypothetical protein